MKKVLAILLSAMLLVGAMPLTAFAEMGGDFPWTGTQDKMLIEEILERDGMIDGIWMPWFNGGTIGHNLTENDLMAAYYQNAKTDSNDDVNWNRIELDYIGADSIYRQIYNLKAMGYNALAYSGSVYGEGVIFDENGDVIGIKENYLANVRRLLNICREADMPVMWNVYFHDSTIPNYYGIDGWYVICQMLGNPEVADHYAENFVRPLCKVLAEYPDVVALVSIADEPENQINDMGKGDHFMGNTDSSRAMYGVNVDDMVYFMQQINEVVREELPGVARTVASNDGNKAIYRDFNLDLMGHNQYTDGDTFKSVVDLITDADPILTEYNIGSAKYTDEEYANKLITYREWMMNNGYKGGFQWCWLPDNAIGNVSSSNGYGLFRTKSDPTSFRKTVSLLHYYIDEYRAEYRGETITLDAPVLYANEGNGVVKFIPSKRAAKITVQRSDDGGATWKTLISNVAQSSYVNSYLVGTYTDTTTRPTSGYCYRIIASDDNGHTVTSAPNDLAGTDQTFKIDYTVPNKPVNGELVETTELSESQAKLTSFGTDKNRPADDSDNLIENGDFEADGGQWNNGNFLQYASVVSDDTTPSGNKSLYFNTSNIGTANWYTFTVDGLKTNTEYTFSTFIKGAYLSDANRGKASIGVIDPDTGKFMVCWRYYKSYPRASRQTQQLYPTACDNEWHIRSVTFNSGDDTSATIALYGASTQMWVDGLALYETVNGVMYDNGESSKAITSTNYEPADGATNAVADPAINNASYWNTGAGYKQGFMSIASGKLKYTASSDPCGVRYTKWINVKPGTDYYVSYTVNVTTAGSGRVAILDDAKLLPYENLTTSFSTTGTKTVTGRISTGKYDKLGICVVDLGGVATLDNVYLYEGEASLVLPTTPSFDGYITNGDFEIGSSTGWENLWNNNTVELVEGRDSNFALKGIAGGAYTQVRQKITVEPNTDYVIEVWAKNVTGTTLIVKNGDTNVVQTGLQGGGSTWTKTVLEFTSGDYNEIHLGFMGNSAGSIWTVDDVKMYKKVTESNDGYIVNGDFETGISSPWVNLWGSNTVTIVDGHNSSYGMKVNAGQYTVVRQKVTVEPNTDYVITLWSKDSVNGSLLVKDSADSQNIVNQSLNTSSTWKETTVEFNSGSNTSVYVGFMGGAAGATYTVDDVTMYKKDAPPTPDTPDTPEDSDILQNGGFEAQGDHWAFNSGTYAFVTDAHSGDYALQLTNPDMWASAAEQTVAVEPGASYTITWWYKATPGTGVFNLYVMNAAGYANLTSTGGKNYMNNFTGSWQQGTYVVNSGSAEAIILKWSTEASNPGTILIDDIAVEKYECDHDWDVSDDPEATCVTSGTKHYYCNNCGANYTETIPATGEHTYDNACDTACNVCGDTRTVPHQYSGACDQYCNLCGAKKTGLSISAPHTYDNACDTACNVCGATRTAPHEYDGSCDQYCNLCDTYRTTYTDHSYSNVCDTACNVCGDTRTAPHEYDGSCDAYCNLCNAYRTAPHKYDGSCDAYCNLCNTYRYTSTAHRYSNDCDAYCNVCNEYRVAFHKYAAECDNYCDNCGEYRDTSVAHSFDEYYPCKGGNCIYCYEYVEATESHTFPYECSEYCAVCGTENDEAKPHVSNTVSCQDGNCIECGMPIPSTGHRYSAPCDTTCGICGYVRGNATITNGGFENGGDGWQFNSGEHAIVADAHSGNGALQLTNPDLWAEGAIQTLDVEPNTEYTITWWYKATPGTGVFNLYVMENAAGYRNLDSSGGQNFMNNYSGEWTQGFYTVDTGSATSIMVKWSTETSNPGTILIDDVSISGGELAEHEYINACTSTCVNCGEETREAGHEYRFECSTICSLCYAETRPEATHNYSSICDEDCNWCGSTRSDAHEYSDDCDIYCDLCGSVREVDHFFENNVCTMCGAVHGFEGPFEYIIQHGEVIITGCQDDNLGNLTIPSTIQGYPVTQIKSGAFWQCLSLTAITIPESVTYIGNGAFAYCENLRDVAILGQVTTLRPGTFAIVGTLDTLIIPESLTTVKTDAFVDTQVKHVYYGGSEADRAHITISDVSNEGFINAEWHYNYCDHSYDSTVTAPDCENGGYTTHTCTKCGDSYTDNHTDALGHTPGAAADCVNAQTCTVCGAELVAALGHSWVGATCTAPKTCSTCGTTEGEALGHSYTADETPADCENDGSIVYTCACGDTYTEVIPAKGHTPGAAADCVNAQTCTVCGQVLNTALGHSWVGATCTAPKTCSTCGTTEGEALGHSYTADETPADCENDGSIVYTCACGDTYTEVIPAKGHTYSGDHDVDCDVCGAIRQVELPISFGGNSVSLDVSGLAFRFDVEVEGLTANRSVANYGNATVNGYKLISMGAIASNGVTSVDIPAVYVFDLKEGKASYAVRVIEIPTDKYDVTITVTPYFVVEIDGEEITLYGKPVDQSVNGALKR